MTDRAEFIRNRYARKVIASPDEPIVVHYGDCEIYRVKICTCGLIQDLMAMGDFAGEIYPKFPEEYGDHLAAIENLFMEQMEERRNGKSRNI